MSESFAELFEESLKELQMAPGAIVSGVVVAIDGDFVTVHAGLKSEGVIPRDQFLDSNGAMTIAVGDDVRVALEAVEDGFGATRLSRDKAKRAEAWAVLETAFSNDEIVKGSIIGKVRGGFTVDLNSIQAFLPGSLVEIRPIRDTAHLEHIELEFKLVKLDERRNNIVVSRRAVLETAYSEERQKLLESMAEGITLKGVVKNLTDYGAFVDLGGIDGLLHITDIAWKRVKHPSELLTVGDEIDVKVLRFDRERNRVSLGMKQLTDDPWTSLMREYSVGTRAPARVTNLTDYGCFAEITDGIEGLVHVSEMDWTNKNVHPSKMVQVGDEIEVMLLDIDHERRRISLGMKQCQQNPWQAFASNYNKGDHYSGVIKSITDFGIFIGLDGGIDGLIHLSDLSWEQGVEASVKDFNKGDTVEAVILSVDPERERIALGIKQLGEDPFSLFVAHSAKGSVVKGVLNEVTQRSATVRLADGVEGTLKAAEASLERVEDLTQLLQVGDELEAIVVMVDRRNRGISLSVKQMTKQQEQQAVAALRDKPAETAGPTTIGDLIRSQMNKNSR